VLGDHREHLGDRIIGYLAVRALHAAGGNLCLLLRGELAQRAVSQGLQFAHFDTTVCRAVLRNRLLLHMRVDEAERSGARQTRQQDQQARRSGSREETSDQSDADRHGRHIRCVLVAAQYRQRRRRLLLVRQRLVLLQILFLHVALHRYEQHLLQSVPLRLAQWQLSQGIQAGAYNIHWVRLAFFTLTIILREPNWTFRSYPFRCFPFHEFYTCRSFLLRLKRRCILCIKSTFAKPYSYRNGALKIEPLEVYEMSEYSKMSAKHCF